MKGDVVLWTAAAKTQAEIKSCKDAVLLGLAQVRSGLRHANTHSMLQLTSHV